MTAGLAHALHDGFTSSIYMLLPLWQAQYGLGFSSLAFLRATYVGVLATLQIPAARLSRRVGIPVILSAGTLMSALGFAFAGAAFGLPVLLLSLAVAGAGSSTQHPLASAAVTQAYRQSSRGPLGTYNFAGDIGKAVFPTALGVLLASLGTSHAFLAVAAFGAVVALLILRLMPKAVEEPPSQVPKESAVAQPAEEKNETGFRLLLLIGVLDSAVGVGLKLFLPVLITAKGGSAASLGLALSLVFLGGAFGKAACGRLAQRIGLVNTVIITEVGTSASIIAFIALPLSPALVLLPILGIMLNGTSSVLYGTIPELSGFNRTEDAFAIFYTFTASSSALAPLLYGLIGDKAGPDLASSVAAATALLIVPIMLLLSPRLSRN